MFKLFYMSGAFYMPSPIFLASDSPSALYARPTMPISTKLITLTVHWASSLPSEWLPTTPEEAAQEWGRVSSPWSKHWTKGVLRKRQPTRSNPFHSSPQGTGQLIGCFCPRRWPILSISWCPHHFTPCLAYFWLQLHILLSAILNQVLVPMSVS